MFLYIYLSFRQAEGPKDVPQATVQSNEFEKCECKSPVCAREPISSARCSNLGDRTVRCARCCA